MAEIQRLFPCACVKCRATDISTLYCDGTGYTHDRNHTASGEHLRRFCKTCGYGWDVRCADDGGSA